MTSPACTPTGERLESFGAALDALRARVVADLGERDVQYIRKVMRGQRLAELAGRAALFGGIVPPLWVAGTALLALSKVLENMEIGHNVMHGQYDWTGDPALNGHLYEWDTVCDGDDWRHSHNFMHHTFTNVVGMDRDLGYGLLRMADDQPWHLRNLPQPLYAVGLMLLFEWGIAVHDIELDRILTGQRPVRDLAARSRRFLRKAARITFKDYVLFPALAGPFAPVVFAGNLTANLTRNVWEFATIFCGHFPSGVQTFLPDEIAQETRGAWYARQAAGSANIEGPAWLHVLCGHLSFQIEHHLFPDLPAHRYPEIAKEVEALCAQHGVPYAKGPFRRQLATAVTRILRCALPPARSRKGKETTPSPGPQPTAPGPMHRRPRAPWRAAPQAATAAREKHRRRGRRSHGLWFVRGSRGLVP